ncbi:BTAD domain-containing putative transcriptional regulator [Solihabitans fulvus]|uniref:BTAD domain-containing putative transcriptional regulator n=1 Tax=Solihabitans fulvus TaxID=1892852 RepID=UPI001661ACA5|nr:BTAD domain-containing putative transcriptional regulator [Solihabitans fulvus]
MEVRTVDGWQPVSSARQRLLLALLIAEAGHVVPIDRIIDHLWPGTPPASGAKVVHTYVGRLRRAIGDTDGSLVVTRHPGYLLAACPNEMDSLAAAEVLRAYRRSDAATPSHEAGCRLDAALNLWRDEPFRDVPEHPVLDQYRATLTSLRLDLLEARADVGLAVGDTGGRLIHLLGEATAAHPLRESLWARYVRVLHAARRRADALQAYQQAYHILRDELGVEPDDELRRAHQEVLADREVLPDQEALVDQEMLADGDALPDREDATVMPVSSAASAADAGAGVGRVGRWWRWSPTRLASVAATAAAVVAFAAASRQVARPEPLEQAQPAPAATPATANLSASGPSGVASSGAATVGSGPLVPGDASVLVADTTYPDGSEVQVSSRFVKIWTIQNAGTVSWRHRYLRAQPPDPGGAPSACVVPERVALDDVGPGGRILVSVSVIAPDHPTQCLVRWKIVDEFDRQCFPNRRPVFFFVNVVE